MFNIVPTLTAVLALLVGLDMAFQDSAPPLSPGALIVLAVVPVGEAALLQARFRKRRGARSGGILWPLVLGLLPPASYAAAALLFGLPRLVFVLGIENWILLDEALLLAPYLAAAALGRLYRHRRAALFSPHRTWRQGRMEMLLGFRGELALVAPFLAFILFGDLLSLSEGLLETVAETPALLYGLILCCLVLLVTVYPPLLRFLWRMKPLDPSFSGRGELLAFIEAQRFRMRNILVWKTGGLQVNAAILGFLPRLRYILISDSMLRVFTIAELKAVLAHEIGHGKRRHTPLFVLMSLAFIALLALVETRFDPLGGLEDELLAAALLYLPALGAYTSLVFGFMSRRFEVEADVHASRALSDPALFIHTLDRLGSVTRRARSRKSWRHFSLERRIAILDSFFPETDGVRDPAGSPALARFERKMKRLKRAALILSLIALGLFAADLAAAGLFTA